MRCIGLVLVLLILAVHSVAAQDKATEKTEPMVQMAPEENDASRLICKTAKETGSRVKRNRICKTRQEWDDMRQNTNKQLDDYSKQAPPNPLPSTSG